MPDQCNPEPMLTDRMAVRLAVRVLQLQSDLAAWRALAEQLYQAIESGTITMATATELITNQRATIARLEAQLSGMTAAMRLNHKAACDARAKVEQQEEQIYLHRVLRQGVVEPVEN